MAQMWCARKLAATMRREHAMGWAPIIMFDGTELERDVAALRLEEQAERWALEIKTGVPNTFDRERMGF